MRTRGLCNLGDCHFFCPFDYPGVGHIFIIWMTSFLMDQQLELVASARWAVETNLSGRSRSTLHILVHGHRKIAEILAKFGVCLLMEWFLCLFEDQNSMTKL